MNHKTKLRANGRPLVGVMFLLVTLIPLGIVLIGPSHSAASEITEGLVDLQAVDVAPQPIRQLQGTHAYFFPVLANNFCAVWPCLKFQDDFSDRDSGWPHERKWSSTESEREYIIGYYSGNFDLEEKYFMRIAHARHVIASPDFHAPSDYVIEADMMFCDDAYLASAGLVFGASDDLRRF
ncbi:MAG: hypothetical protein SVX38_13855, partial [Chloroflexota bacterium]|nr:hypothetical protein [Chloroflexota bacterium]